MKKLIVAFLLCVSVCGAEDWQAQFAKIPLPTNSFRAHLTEPVSLILTNFRPTAEVRCVVLMPAAADQLYFLDHGQINLPANATLLDAVTALCQRANLHATVVPPFLLLHMDKDTTSEPIHLGPNTSLEKVEKRKIPGKTYYLDRPYDRIISKVGRQTGLEIKPTWMSKDSWHFYRLAFVGYDLNGAELVRAVAYGTKTAVQIEKNRATFQETRPQP